MDFTTNDEVGILIEGFERRPRILENWHPPYYHGLIEAHGFGKAMDLLMWDLQFGRLKDGERFDPSIHAAAKKGAATRKGSRSATTASANRPPRCAASPTSTTRPGATTGASSRPTDAEVELPRQDC